MQLYVLSPFYLCRVGNFGGLPAWLLTKDMRIRSSDPAYVEMVGRYYDHLLPRLVSDCWIMVVTSS